MILYSKAHNYLDTNGRARLETSPTEERDYCSPKCPHVFGFYYQVSIIQRLVALLRVRTLHDGDYLVRCDVSNYVNDAAGPSRFDVVDAFVRTNSKMEA